MAAHGADGLEGVFAPFIPRHDSDIKRLVDAYPLAWVISRQFSCAPLPLIAETDADNQIVSFLGHCGRRNHLVADLRNDNRALALFNGPSDYISPDLVSRSDWAPTWNYAVVRFEMNIEFVEDETQSALDRLLEHMAGKDEPAWSRDALGDRYDAMLARIIGFRGYVTKTIPSFKLGQDEGAKELHEILERHPNDDLKKWMHSQM